MAKNKDRWQNDDSALQNPFAALVGVKTSVISSHDESKKDDAVPKTQKISLPRVKSSRLERAHRGGKTVTVVAFHGTPTDDAKLAWLKAAKTKLGVGGALEEGVVVLQGDQRERIEGIFLSI